jgi:hypothetical protein
MSEIALNWANTLEIDVTPTGDNPTWAQIHEGFSNVAESLNEVLYQASYLGDSGWGSTEVTGGQYIITLTGKRVFGNTAQDWIFSDSTVYEFGNSRKTTLRLTRQNGDIIQWDITLANITNSGGDANTAADISVAIHGNGAPTFISGGLLSILAVVSVAGSVTGDTAVYINPLITASHSYKYRTGTSVDLPQYDDVLTTGWTAWDGSDEITAITGQKIVVAEILTADNKAKKAGITTVTTA